MDEPGLPHFRYDFLYQTEAHDSAEAGSEDGLLRVIEVSPDGVSGMIEISMRTIRIGEPYSCLSYTWGESVESMPHVLVKSTVKGFTNRGVMPVRSNLYNFLQLAKSRFHSRPLWIDALSINQADDYEKSHQVREMGEIFSNAEQVIAWLGTDSLVSEFIRQVRLGNGIGIFRDHHAEWLAFHQLDYWDRAWVTQEIGLARTVLLVTSEEEVDYERALRYLYDPRIPPTGGLFQGRSLAFLLDRFTDKKCAIDLDRVYSLLSLCDAEERKLITPDYSLSRDHVFMQTLRACQDNLCLCTVLSVGRALNPQVQNIPLNTMVELNLIPTTSSHSCPSSYQAPGWPSIKGRESQEVYHFCLAASSHCVDGFVPSEPRWPKMSEEDDENAFSLHFSCVRVPETGKYRVYHTRSRLRNGTRSSWYEGDVKSRAEIRESYSWTMCDVTYGR